MASPPASPTSPASLASPEPRTSRLRIERVFEWDVPPDPPPSTSMYSPAFDPLGALYTPNVAAIPEVHLIPGPIRTFDHVGQYEAFRDGRIQASEQKARAKKAEQAAAQEAPLQRRFLPEQMPVPVDGPPGKNVLTYMERQATKGGPMAFLSECVNQRIRVKVVVRGAVSIRGSLEAFVLAFDKYWNLVLSDVDELFSRKRRGPSMFTDQDATEANVWTWRNPNRPKGSQKKRTPVKTEQVGSTTLHILKTRRKTELCQRHLPQTLLRGEHIVTVAKLK
ncbi:hypothetical protein TCAL_11209 [Tigriopus californicus]|uniref:Sm domain-containing protein n=1 Tax=Tigriopus californicus TaxID=6832 RepID=A0A553PCY1_TIGCA|nr:hypothetical protein TCAL_11209 [Tigriopus californicus]|eukprot:TCALIF_11209-PA protein Name:"Similar to lsm11 U7 snRNA-associated Sm-like protein LSm11 (Xenopus laevis)" AED:0.16 eAED:0.16 QI:0/-1/0/1/-1/1/1/0/278